MPITSLEEAIRIAKEQMHRGRLKMLYIVDIGGEYIICSIAYIPQLSNEYETFHIAMIVHEDE